jgi:polyhydroxyalkanoate synthesis regulator phasin
MKKIAFLMIASLFSVAAIQAQMPMDPKEMAQQMTDRMVEQYSLKADQSKKLLEANTEFATKMSEAFGQGQPDMAAFQKVQEEHTAKLKTILTEEQFKAYEKEQAEMRARFGGGA